MGSVSGNRMYLYRAYVRHNWGTDKFIVTSSRRDVGYAGELAVSRALRIGLRGIEVIDVVPMKRVEGVWIETRRMRVRSGAWVGRRRARARVSVRASRRVPCRVVI